MNFRKTLIFALVMMLMAFTIAACGGQTSEQETTNETESSSSTETTETPKEEKIKIGLSMDSLEAAFWVANHKAIYDKANELNVEIVEVIAEGDANKQNQQIENLIAQGVKAIIIAPKDGGAISVAVKKAQDAGIPVVMNNRPVTGDVVPDLQVLSDNKVMARDVAQWFVDKAKKENKKYKAILLIGGLADQNAVERYDGHKLVLDANKDVIEVVAEVPTDWNLETALTGLQNALQANPEVDLIITPSDYLFPPIKSALEQNNKWAKMGEPNHVAIISFDGDEVGSKHLIDGYNWADAAQAADKTGWTAVEWAVKLANGEKPPENVIRDPGTLLTYENQAEVGPTVWGYIEATK